MPDRSPPGAFVASALMALALAVAVGGYLLHTQSAARQKLREDFAHRAVLAARLAHGVLSSQVATTKASARETFSGSDTVPAAGFRQEALGHRIGLAVR